MIIVDATQLVIPQIVKHVVDSLNFNTFNRTTLLYQCIFIIGLGLCMAALRYGWRIFLMGSARDVEKGIRDTLFKHVLHLDMNFHNSFKTGDIMAHATSDINHIRMAFGFGLIVMVDTLLLGSATLAIMFWTHPKLTAVSLLPMPLLVYVTRNLGQKMHQFHTTAQEAFSQLTEMVRESFYGIRIIKVFNFEQIIEKKIENASKDYFKKNIKRAVVTALLRPMLGFFFNISTLIIIFYGGFLVIEKTISPGELVAFIQYLGILAWPVIAIGWMTNLYQRGMASLKRINKLLEASPDVKPKPDGTQPDFTNTGICFKNVSFSYQNGPLVLSDINIDIKPNTSIGISGPPGSGKTSLAQLIPGLYNINNGKIFINKHDLDNISLEYLRSQISFMPQESFLFSGTIRDNILMGNSVPEERINTIIEACCLETTLSKMSQGLDTIVGERGITLSGGQKQRIALARALIVPRPLIILDDPISQMDTHTASKVMTNLHNLIHKATLILISHRVSALAPCSRIHILNKGKIENTGTHEELIKSSQFYSESFRIQQFEEEQNV